MGFLAHPPMFRLIRYYWHRFWNGISQNSFLWHPMFRLIRYYWLNMQEVWVCRVGWDILVGSNNTPGSHKFPQQWTEIPNPTAIIVKQSLDDFRCQNHHHQDTCMVDCIYRLDHHHHHHHHCEDTCMVDCIKAGCTDLLPSLCCTRKLESPA